jgi:type IV secretion system protein VirB10
MKRVPELTVLAQSDEAEVAETTLRRNRVIGGSALVVAGMAAAYLVIGGETPNAPDMLDADEEFATTTFRPPSFVREPQPQPQAPKPEIIEVPPPPEQPTEFEVPPPPPPKAVPDSPKPPEQPADTFPDRYRSSLVVYDTSAPPSEAGGLFGAEGQAGAVAGEDRNSRFLAAAAARGERAARATKIDRIDALVPEGTLIPGILETAIVSDLPGQIRAIVAQDVYAFDGRRVLIPAGTRLIGEYQSDVIRGQKRIFVIWTRLLRDDGVSVRLDSIGADSLGRSGLAGHVDNKFRERFGAAIVISVVGAAASYLTGYGSETASGGSEDAERGEEIARTTIAQTFSDMANQVLGENLKIAPTISVSQGERVFVFVRQDLDFSSFYEDPVNQALKEIRRERNLP